LEIGNCKLERWGKMFSGGYDHNDIGVKVGEGERDPAGFWGQSGEKYFEKVMIITNWGVKVGEGIADHGRD
jgi:hypothetical protein